MARMFRHHQELTDGVGKCSVPMWADGCPAGFCDRPAYGQQTKEYLEEHQLTRLRPAYAPGLACPGHGGPARNVVVAAGKEGT